MFFVISNAVRASSLNIGRLRVRKSCEMSVVWLKLHFILCLLEERSEVLSIVLIDVDFVLVKSSSLKE